MYDVIQKSDLCFVWIWERRSGTPKGLGALCLRSALQDIRRRFMKVRTVVFDTRPGQFLNWTSKVDPPMVALEKQTAVENLVSHIQGLALEFDVRSIFARSDDPMRESVIAFSQAMDSRHRAFMARAEDEDNEDDGENEETEIDLTRRWGEAIFGLLTLAGLDELAGEFEDGDAAYDEVVTAVKHIVFDSAVHYLRPSSTGRFNPAHLEHEKVVPHDDAHDQIVGMDEFCAELPANMRVVAVHWLEEYAVCTVRAVTPFGELDEYFTLVRKPRPVNVDNYFRGID